MSLAQKVWLVTGTSSGLGKELVSSVLARGDRVIGTVRNLKDAPIVSDAARQRLHVVKLDVTDQPENVQRVVNEAAAIWGQIDVLVNNAGFGVMSTLEEAAPLTLQKQFQTNVFGSINVTNAALPHMRARHSGTIIMIGSRSAWQGVNMPLAGAYAASKAAVHSLGETYFIELRQFGIRVCIVAPGAFRTNNVVNMYTTRDQHISDYDELREERGVLIKNMARAVGDPKKAMELLVDAVRGEGRAQGKELPLYLPLGRITIDKLRDHCQKLLRDLNEWEDLAKDLDFDEA
ncbi:NAD(P)-binding protein [Sparassis crispa]|uniref:NAD(P)-binding protein n=1 Tax=Sparassis crispa TaxID=139825 RepID=A0A401GDI3_9APHY|nr:NAD(P)-binding protein [Sparassis crispa]GBE80232.1 NAD(P)-binding protein [Sparassis crispa]